MRRTSPSFLLILFAALTLFCSGFSFGALGATSYTLASEASQTITEFSVCRIVENQSSFKRDLFIGTKTATEWASFYNNPPNRVSAPRCNLTAVGAIATWGMRYWGGLGDGLIASTSVPTLLPGSGSWRSATWKKLAAAGYNTCGILTDETIRCWGYNAYGQDGDNTSLHKELPVALNGTWASTTWSDISGGNHTICAIRKADSYLFCWGYNERGTIGDNTQSNRAVPTALYATGGWNTTAWKAVSVGGNFVCALRSSDSRMFCWGYNAWGQKGNGVTDVYDDENIYADYPTPLTSTGGWDTTSWASVSTGSNHVCAIRTSDTRMYCWGYNAAGQLGTGNTTATNVPVAMTSTGSWNTATWKSVTAGDTNTCAIRTDNTVACWGTGGRNGNGSGSSTSTPSLLTATDDWDTSTWTSISTGLVNTCGIQTTTNRLYCWGTNTYGNLGNGTQTISYVPSPLTVSDNWNTATWKQISVGRYFACGILTDNTVACWGLAANGQLAGLLNRNYPAGLDGADGWESTVWSMGAVGQDHVCAIRSSDSIMACWGLNNYTQLGAASTYGSGSYTPQYLTTTGGWNAVAWKDVTAMSEATCGIKTSDNTIACWGRNVYGQLGDGTNTNHGTPAPLGGGFATTAWDSLAVSKSGGHFCAIRSSDYRMFCWGLNNYGQLGNGTVNVTGDYSTNVPTPLTSTGGWSTTQWKSASTGSRNTCGVRRTDNRIFCWGNNSYYQLADGTTTQSATPVAMTTTGGWDVSTWKTVSVGYLTACGIRSDDTIYCWGYNGYGNIGDGTTGGSKTAPTALTATGGFNTMTWKWLFTGHSPNRTCAIRLSNNALYCWGDNRYGELGTGNETNVNVPTLLTSTNGWSTEQWKSVYVGSTVTFGITQ